MENPKDRFSLDKENNLSVLEHRVTLMTPKFSDILVWANSADQDQTAPRGAV